MGHVMQVEVSTLVRAPAETTYEVYASYRDWPRLFPTISGVRLIHRHGDELVLMVDHVEGQVVNKLVLHPPEEIDLWEDKRRYDARFKNRFEAVPEGTRFTVRGEINLKGYARLLRPFLKGYIRRQMERFQVQPVKREAETRARPSRP